MSLEAVFRSMAYGLGDSASEILNSGGKRLIPTKFTSPRVLIKSIVKSGESYSIQGREISTQHGRYAFKWRQNESGMFELILHQTTPQKHGLAYIREIEKSYLKFVQEETVASVLSQAENLGYEVVSHEVDKSGTVQLILRTE